MNDLSDDARALFDAARGAHEPSENARERVRNATLLRVGALAAGTTLARSATATGKVALGLKLGLGVVVAGSLAASSYFSLRSATVASAGAAASSHGTPTSRRAEQPQAPPTAVAAAPGSSSSVPLVAPAQQRI